MSTTQKERYEVIARLEKLGIDYQTAQTLRRISLTLQRWFELECGDGNDYASWSIERDEESNLPYKCVYPHHGKNSRHRIADRETGARKRLARIMADFPKLTYYVQSDPRGCALYILRKSDLEGAGKTYGIESVYTRGVAVY